MQSFRRLMLIGGGIAGCYCIYRIYRDWWSRPVSGPPPAITETPDYDENEVTISTGNEVASPEVMSVASNVPRLDAVSECAWPLAEEQMLSDSEIEWKFRNIEMFGEDDVVGAFDEYDEEAILTKLRTFVASQSRENASSPTISAIIDPENEEFTLDVAEPQHRKRKRFKRGRTLLQYKMRRKLKKLRTSLQSCF